MRHLFWIILLLSNFSLISAYNTGDYPPITAENTQFLEEVEVLGHGKMNEFVAISDTGQIVVGGDSGIFFYENLEAELQFIERGHRIVSLFFAGDTLFFTSNGNLNELYAYDLTNQRDLYAKEGQSSLAVSQDGTMLAYEVDMGIRVLEIATGEVLYDLDYNNTFEFADGISNIAFPYVQFFNEDSQLYVAWSDGHVSHADVWTLADQSRQTFDGFFQLPETGDFAGFDANGEAIVLPELENLPENGFTKFYDFRSAWVISGNLIAAPYYFEVQGRDSIASTGVWDWRTGEEIARFPVQGHIQLNANNGLIAIGRQVFSIATSQSLRTFQTESYELFGNNILEYSLDGSLRLLDGDNSELITVLPINQNDLDNIPSAVYSQNYEILVHKNQQLAILIDSATGQEVSRFESEEAIFEFWSWWFNENETFVFSYNGIDGDNVYLWNVATGEQVNPEGIYRILDRWFHQGNSVLVQTREGVSLYNPETETFAWTFPIDIQRGFEEFHYWSDYTMIVRGASFEMYDFHSHELLFEIDNLYYDYYGYTSTISWRGDKLAYIEYPHEIVVVSLPDGEELQRIEDAYGSLFFYDENTLELEDENTYESTYYDIRTGEIVPDPPLSYSPRPFIETESLNFYQDYGLIWIESKDGQVLREIVFEDTYPFAVLTSDGTRLMIPQADKSISVWAVEE